MLQSLVGYKEEFLLDVERVSCEPMEASHEKHVTDNNNHHIVIVDSKTVTMKAAVIKKKGMVQILVIANHSEEIKKCAPSLNKAHADTEYQEEVVVCASSYTEKYAMPTD